MANPFIGSPPHWPRARLRSLIATASNGSWGSDPGLDNEARCIRAADFDRVHLTVREGGGVVRGYSGPELDDHSLARGDLLLEKSGGGEHQPVGKVVLFDEDGLCVPSNFTARLRPTAQVVPKWLCYAFEACYAAGINRRYIKQSTGLQNLDWNSYAGERIATPSRKRQQEIVRFLDTRMARIDGAIQKAQQLVYRLDEQRRAVASDSVTRGVRGGPFGESRVPWIRQIPRRWHVRRIKQVARLASGHTPSRSEATFWVDPTIFWFQLTDIWQFRDDSLEEVTETAEMISETGLRHSAAELLPAGTVALSRTASVGFSAILGRDMATTQDFANWVPGPLVRSAYLLYVLRAMRPELERLRFGSTHKTIYMPDIRNLVMPLPPIDEQDEIVAHIRKESKVLLEARASVKKAILRLQEYRASLITAAITGQLDIPEAS